MSNITRIAPSWMTRMNNIVFDAQLRDGGVNPELLRQLAALAEIIEADAAAAASPNGDVGHER